MWAIRTSYLFCDDSQRANMYHGIEASEFFACLLMPSVDAHGQPQEIELEKVRMDPDVLDTIWNINELRNKAKKDTALKVVVRRYSPKVDKKIRDKDHLWIRWNVQSSTSVKHIIHYFMVLRPILRKLAKEYGLDYNNDACFLHTKTLRPLLGSDLLSDKSRFYNFHAEKNGWSKIPEKPSANIWRHAFATTEMDKYYNADDYQWCTSPEQVAKLIGYFMNSSVKEVMDTYTSRINSTATSASSVAAGRSRTVLELSSDEEDDVPRSPSKRTKTDRSSG
jgi:hypothetical protein